MLLKNPYIDVNGGEKKPLYAASKHGHMKIVQTLLEYPDVDVNRGNGRGNTPLSAACQRGHTKIAKILLAKENINVNLGNPLSPAIENGLVEISKTLLEYPNIKLYNLKKLIFRAADDFEPENIVRLLATATLLPSTHVKLGYSYRRMEDINNFMEADKVERIMTTSIGESPFKRREEKNAFKESIDSQIKHRKWDQALDLIINHKDFQNLHFKEDISSMFNKPFGLRIKDIHLSKRMRLGLSNAESI
eukprot:gb/GECH01010026.1/.p1 GENE.gb/GECH01010026.1/~~gb/GECH01010026.1/.p1  ORF type:complete len:248 (+),score=25.37 gb/GECH01010026.1/:1-744(+)